MRVCGCVCACVCERSIPIAKLTAQLAVDASDCHPHNANVECLTNQLGFAAPVVSIGVCSQSLLAT